ncbi:hypothetical protein [Arthrobacter sp. ISL-28]|uniref:hypothetical protein n=1 Tax=Arthrobacter sp. ISL-28 TaxID=2819108 RepID=UPI00288A8083|nr:hypothetical protein [Arthrobacter sp. ISL-28]
MVGSTRPGRRRKQVADWVLSRAITRGGADFELLDLVDCESCRQHSRFGWLVAKQKLSRRWSLCCGR